MHTSQENIPPQIGRLKHNPSFIQTTEMVKEHLRRHQRHSPSPPTTQEIRQKAAKILDEFLKEHLENESGSHQVPVIVSKDSEKSRSGERDIKHTLPENYENDSIKSIGSAKQTNLNFPYADEDEDLIGTPENQNVTDNESLNELELREPPAKPPAEPPVGSDLKHIDRSRHSDIDVIHVMKRTVISGSVSSVDSEMSAIVAQQHRKKKSLFKRARERLNRFIQRERELNKESDIKDKVNEKSSVKTKKVKKPKRKKSGKGVKDETSYTQTDIREDVTQSNGGIIGTLRRFSLKKIKRRNSKSLSDLAGMKIEKSSIKYKMVKRQGGDHVDGREIEDNDVLKDHKKRLHEKSSTTTTDDQLLIKTVMDTNDDGDRVCECHESVKEAKFKRGSVTVDIVEHHYRYTSLDDLEIDGLNDKGDDKTDETKERLIGEIANRIAEIGDNYVESPESGSPTATSPRPVPSNSPRDKEGLNTLERELRDYFRVVGDNINDKLNISDQTTEAVKQSTYNTFKGTIERTIGDDIGWNQLAMLFYVTKKGIQLAGAGGTAAVQIKENCLTYIEDKFATWIVKQGGWETVLTDTDSTDSELD